MFVNKAKQTFPPIIWIFIEGEGDRIDPDYLLKSFLLIFQTTFWNLSYLFYLISNVLFLGDADF